MSALDPASLIAAIVDESPDIIFAKDRDGRMLYANPAALRLIGKPMDAVLGRTDAEFLDDAVAAAQVMANDARIMANGVAEEVEEPVPMPDGSRRVWLSRKMPYRDADGRVIGLMGVSRDITERKALEDEVRGSQARLQRTLDSISDGLAVFDRDWNYTYLSERGAELLGSDSEAHVGRNVWTLYPHARDNEFGRAMREAMDTGRRTTAEAYYPEPLNRWIEARCYPGEDGLSLFFRDVTQQRAAEGSLAASEGRLRRVFEASPMGMVTGDAEGRILSGNDAFLRIVGHGRDDLAAGRVRWDALTPPDLLPLDLAAIEEVRRRGICTPYEKEYIRVDGSRVPVMVGLAAFEDDQLIAFVIDITERKQAERALRDAATRKDEFLAMLAHELRNPLAPLGTAAQLLRLASEDPQRVRTVAAVVDRQVRHLAELVDDLLDVSRVTRGLVELVREPVDLKATVAAAVEQARPLIEARGHTLAVRARATAVPVLGDPHRLVQVLSNLLNNAAKYTPPGGRIDLEVEAEGAEVVVRVCDDGLGIPDDLLPCVFDLFTQGERTPDRSQGGLGIGLALVRSIVELHGGSVSAASAGPGKGSTFTVRLPRIAEPGAAAGVRPQAPARGHGRVLVVDDNADAAHTLADVLRLSGFEVTVAGTAHAALEATDGPWQACVLDIGLPDLTGHELAKRLRALPGGGEAVMVALTGYGQPQDLERSQAAGFDHHFVKPADLPALLEAISPHALA